MLPVVQGGDNLTVEITLLTTLLLIPLGLTATLSGMAGLVYACIGVALGLGFAWFALNFFRQRDRESARSTFLFSLLYLPVLMAAMVLNRNVVPMAELVTVEMNPDAVIQPEASRD